MIIITDAAAQHLQALAADKGEPGKGLRIFVEKGGCAGLQYGMTLDDAAPNDTVSEHAGVKVIVDPESEAFLRGSTLDYCDDLAGTGFRLHNPNAVRSCGCGTSFEPAAAEESSAAH